VSAVRILGDSGVTAFIDEHGGRLWVWLDPHGGLGGPAVIYLEAAPERPGATRATRRKRSARRPHRFTSYTMDGLEVLCDFGRFDPPDELHLAVKRFPKRRIEAFWNGAIFVTDDLPQGP
jgi:hypothetical protein